MKYAIYMDRDKHYDQALLMDGCWTADTNCYMREFGVVWHKPRLFPRAQDARAWIRKYLDPLCLGYVQQEYRGPTEPWERAADRESAV